MAITDELRHYIEGAEQLYGKEVDTDEKTYWQVISARGHTVPPRWKVES